MQLKSTDSRVEGEFRTLLMEESPLKHNDVSWIRAGSFSTVKTNHLFLFLFLRSIALTIASTNKKCVY